MLTLQIRKAGNMGITSCLGQGGLRSLSVLVLNLNPLAVYKESINCAFIGEHKRDRSRIGLMSHLSLA